MADAVLSVVAFGGNALQRQDERGSIHEMRGNARAALRALEPLLRDGGGLCITHGNGPQVGSALLRGDAAEAEVPAHPLDIAVATTQAEIGSVLQTELLGVLHELDLQREVLTIVTHVVVDANDAALSNPTKPIGPFYDERQAKSLASGRGWSIVEDAGRGYRRVVGSPRPLEVLELASIRRLLEAGAVVICGGGGGIPISMRDAEAHGVEAVIDKDRTAALLARELDAERLIILTAVDAVYADFGSEQQRALPELSVRQAQSLLDSAMLPAGSMAPKVEAAAEFARMTGRPALITSESALARALEEPASAGTWISPS